MRYFSRISRHDRVGLLAVGATAPTTHLPWWRSIAKKCSHNIEKAKFVVFETYSSPLVKGGHCEYIGGGYYCCEFDLTVLGECLQRTTTQNLEPYATLIGIWKAASRNRKKLKKLFKEKAKGEGQGRQRHFRPLPSAKVYSKVNINCHFRYAWAVSKHDVMDQQARVLLIHRIPLVLQDADNLVIRPVVQDGMQVIRPSVLDGLQREQVVTHLPNAVMQGDGLNDGRKVLQD